LASALVTGCAGFIGSHLTESLLADGWDVTGVDMRDGDNLLTAHEYDGFELVRGDLTELEPRELTGRDVVFHLAGEPGVRGSWGERFDVYTRRNVTVTQRLLEAVDVGTRFVYASSSSVYGDALRLPTREDATPRPLSPYGVTKLAAEHLCVLYASQRATDTIALRFFSVYGPRQRPDMAFRRFCEAIASGEPISVYGDGHQTRDFTYVDDVVAATRAAAAAQRGGGRVYNVGGGSRVSLNRALELLAGHAGRPLDVRRGEREAGDAHDNGAVISRARGELGYAPATSVREGLGAELDWVFAQRSLASLSARWQSRRSSPSWRLTSASSSMRRSR
jgi:nucleoside-diphosphate-sugar epimerase